MTEAQQQAHNAALNAKMIQFNTGIAMACGTKEGVAVEFKGRYSNYIKYKGESICFTIDFQKEGYGYHKNDNLKKPFITVGGYGEKKMFKKVSESGDLEYAKIVEYCMERADEEIQKDITRNEKSNRYNKAKQERAEIAAETGCYEHNIDLSEWGTFKVSVNMTDKETAKKVIEAMLALGVLKKDEKK